MEFYALIFDPKDAVWFQGIAQEVTISTSWTSPNESVVAKLVADRENDLLHAPQPVLRERGLLRWPLSLDNAVSLMSTAPSTLGEWSMRNYLWQIVCGGFLYRADRETLGSPDLMSHLTYAQMSGGVSVGIFPYGERQPIDPTVLSYTNALFGEADGRLVGAFLHSLRKETPQGEL